MEKIGKQSVNLDADLRKQLLWASIALVTVVLLLLTKVAYQLSIDVGESIEQETLLAQANTMSDVLSRLSFEYRPEGKDELNISKFKSTIQLKLSENLVHFELQFNGRVYNILDGLRNDNWLSDYFSHTQTGSGHGLVENNGLQYFWVIEKHSNYNYLLIQSLHSKERTLDFFLKRFSVSALIIFWLAVWLALTVSSLITKRFVKGNIRLKYLANYDMLTDLPNRYNLHDIVSNYFEKHGADSKIKQGAENNVKASLILIDLNKFKEINDTMGHRIGDRLLKEVATRISNAAPRGSRTFRYGGDEFIVWCEGIEQKEVESIAQKLLEICRRPVLINETQFEITVSIGISHHPRDGSSFNQLFSAADVAMYHAKQQRLGYVEFSRNLDATSILKVNLSGQLHQALTDNQFVLHYQPKFHLKSKQIFGVEALVRWQHPNEGLLYPNSFIGIIEQSSFVQLFTRQILKLSIVQCRQWLDNNIRLIVSVNISPYNLMDPLLVTTLKELLVSYDVPPELIEFELTESATMVGIETTERIFNQLKDVGIKLSIDDFGTGMSSLAYIKRLNFDYIKLDRAFVQNIVSDYQDEALVMSTLLLANKLDKELIIEGVEIQEQYDKLLELGCEFAQGYFFAKPKPAQELADLLKHSKISEYF
ncbi:MAG: bifunctional diguanylate cyclase/phosphodiesterase [Kangiellaceae bacterium]|jgi:diguanylate cyclase (GGDEF)-like protein